MLQQTVVAAVIPYFGNFVEKWPTIHKLAKAKQEEIMAAWAGLGYYARARNLHKCAGVVSRERDGVFPQTPDELKELPGIGDYTSAAITAIAFDKPATVVDGNVERVTARYFAVTEPLPGSKKELRRLAGILSDGREDRPGDFAQAMMDLGATVCIPASPRCGSCPVAAGCAGRKRGIAAELPYKIKAARKPQKKGFVYWIRDAQGRVLLERRPEKGLLGGMLGLPTSEWVDVKENPPAHPAYLKACRPNEKITVFHSFTHFDLTLTGVFIEMEKFPRGASFVGMEAKKAGKAGLPTLFKKFARLAARNEKSREK
jgi:A/G-specific adenine glycosylase